MNKTMMKKYAALIARVGANVQKGQPVVIYAEVDQGEFVSYVTEECYKAGASRVSHEWSYQPITKMNYKYRTLKSLSTVPAWQEAKLQQAVEEVPCRIRIESADPDGLRGINREKVQKSRIATYPILKKYNDALENKDQWTIAAVPSYAWAKKVFPGEKKNKAYEMLWEAILNAVRVTKDNDPVEAWRLHNEKFKEKCAWLNEKHFDYLEYKSANGTDFRCSLIPEGKWCGGGDTSLLGRFFNPNLPTEEIFISPMRGKAEGKLVSTKPLSYQGQLIENFSIRFEGGKAVEVHAEKNEELLKQLISMDEGAAYLGECALVPYDSPIQNSGLLFYNTLFDENAACHLALGKGFADTIHGFEELSLEECYKMGLNDSMVHEDFMIGSEDLDIDAHTRDGKIVPIFRKGNWAF